MLTNKLQQARAGALMIGTMAALAACSPRGDNANTAGESGAATTSTAAGALDSGAAAVGAGAAAVGAGAAAVGAGAAAATSGMGDSAMNNGAANAGGVPMSDAVIAGTVNTSNAAEIGTSELAQQRAQSREVKSFANEMIQDHRRLQKQADQVAKQNNLVPQPGAEANQMQQMVAATVDSLKALKGAEFDQRYMAFQVQSHQMTLDKLRNFETQTQNADLKAVITKAIPVVQQHLERAQKIQSGLGGSAASDSTKS